MGRSIRSTASMVVYHKWPTLTASSLPSLASLYKMGLAIPTISAISVRV